MLVFAHNGVSHANKVESATHSLLSVALVSLAAIALLGLAVWLLSRKPAVQEADETEDDT